MDFVWSDFCLHCCIVYVQDENRVRAAEVSKQEKARKDSKTGKANITKIRPWSALSKDSSASCHHHHQSTSSHRPKTATGELKHSLTPQTQTPHLGKPKLKVQSRLRNGNPVVPDKSMRPLIEITRHNGRRGSDNRGSYHKTCVGDGDKLKNKFKWNMAKKQLGASGWAPTEVSDSLYNSEYISCLFCVSCSFLTALYYIYW